MIHPVKIPKVNDNDEFIILAEWFVMEGDYVEVGTPLCCIETSKATFDLESEAEGYIKDIRYKQDDEAELFEIICFIVDSPDTEIPSKFIKDSNERQPAGGSHWNRAGDGDNDNIMATLEAKRMAFKHNLDLSNINKKGIIRTKDVEEFMRKQKNESVEQGQDFELRKSKIIGYPVEEAGIGGMDTNLLRLEEIENENIRLKKIAVYGAGDHGIMIKDFIDASPGCQFSGFLDNKKPKGTVVSNVSVLGGRSCLKHLKEDGVDEIFVTVFDRHLREDLNAEGKEYGLKLANIIHPTAIIGHQVSIQEGCFIKAGAIIDSYSIIGEGTIIDNGAVIAHHNHIGRYCHITPGVVTGGRVVIGDYSLIAIGAKIMSMMVIGEDCWVDIGCVVKKSFLENNIFISGSPAKIKAKKK
ncbi:biotin/lipoyl-containing protein [Thermodesulfobacteriota bacterium]